MKRTFLIMITTFCISVSGSIAAEKSKIVIKLDASRAAVEALAGRIGENREAAGDLDQARLFLKKAADAHEKGLQVLGFNIGGLGTLKPEVEEEIKNYLDISDLSVATASSRLEKARAANELETIEKQLAGVKTRLKAFEDRKAELEKLKTENTRLAGQIEKQMAEIKALNSQLEEAKRAAAKREGTEPAAPAKAVSAPVSTPVPVKESPAKETMPGKDSPEK
jgi:DNA repair exonuclease SbcCD ATPase subunit